MLKPLTLSLSLAVALGFCSVSMAGHGDGCSGCGLASPQAGPVPSAQGPIATCAPTCAPRKSCLSGLGCQLSSLQCKLKSLCNPPVTYEWVLKKKICWGQLGGGCAPCGGAAPCGAAPVYPTGQVAPSGQGIVPGPVPAPIYGAGQHAYKAAKPTATVASVPSDMTPAIPGEEAPPAPEVKETSASGLLLPTPSGN